MPLEILRDDITRVAADAIVNTSNPAPAVGPGADAALHEAAGPELLEARKRIGPIAPGNCAATPAFALPARYVLHAVSPIWAGGEHGEAETLRKTYDAALALAAELGCRSVATPLLAAGSNGFPRTLALSVAIRAITDFLMTHEETTVYLVLFNGKAFDLAGALFGDLKSYIDDRYVARQERTQRFPRPLLNRRETAVAQREDFDLCDEGSYSASMANVCQVPAGSAKAGGGLEDLLRQREAGFSEFLLELLRERGGKDSEVYKRAEVSRQLFSKILSTPDYQPTKSTAIQLAIGLELDLNQTQKLLEKAGYALTRSSRSDLVVQYYIERQVYSVPFINAALDDCGLPPLKTGLKA